MLKEVALDKATVDAYHEWVQRGIRNDLNSLGLGPGKLPFRGAVALVIFGFASLLVGILLVALRNRHVYLWDWNAQFLGPFFFILFLLCIAGAVYLIVIAKRRSNKYRSQLYFKPIGDWGVSCVHKSELARVEEFKHELKSGTTPHKTIKPRSEAYSQSSKDVRKVKHHDGRDNHGYDQSPVDGNGPSESKKPIGRYGQNPDAHVHKGAPPPSARRGPHPDGRRGPPPDGRRGPPPDGRRGPPPDGRRGPPPDGRRGPPPDGRRGPPPDGRRGPPPDGRRGPPPDGRRGPPPDGRRGPPPDDRRGPPPNGRRGPPPNGRNGSNSDDPPEYNGLRNGEDEYSRVERRAPAVQLPADENEVRRPRGAPRFGNVERIPDTHRQTVQSITDRSHESESEI